MLKKSNHIDPLEKFVTWCATHKLISVAAVLALLALILFVIPYFLTKTNVGFSFDSTSADIGDTIAGTAGIGIAFLAALLTFLAFWVQFRANQQQRAAIQHDRFEGRLFELIRLYRESVQEMNIQGVRFGRDCFIPMFKEFKCLFWIAKCEQEKFLSGNPAEIRIDDKNLCRIAYSVFFNGVGIESNKLRKDPKPEHKQFIKHLDKAVYAIQKEYRRHVELPGHSTDTQNAPTKFFLHFVDGSYDCKCGTISEVLDLHSEATEQEKPGVFIYEPKYYPFDGHVTRLGHYYRHLFQIVRFVVAKEREEELLHWEEALEYLKLLRTQMSNHEQLLLYYNAVGGPGKKWEFDSNNGGVNYFIHYRMIHNVPFPAADFGIPVQKRYEEIIADGEGVFEWEQG